MKKYLRTEDIIKAILLIAIFLTFSGCASRSYSPTTNKVESEKKKEIIKLFNQEFDYPKEQISITPRLYPSTHLKGKMGHSFYKWDDVPRDISSSTFCFKKTGSRRFDVPYYAVKFKYPIVIKNILIYHTEEAYDDRGQKIAIRPALYCIKDKERSEGSYVFSKANYGYYYQATESIDKKSGVRVDSLNFDRDKPLKQIFLAFDDLQDLSSTSYINLKKKPMIKIEGYSVEAVVLNALKTREDREYNEKLVREVGFKNTRLFRLIQKNANKCKLPKSSVAYLPRDINVNYALKNHAKIIKTGRYLASNGKYKHYKAKTLFDSSYKYNSKHRVKVTGEKATIKKSSSSHKTAGFIDFSEGI